MTNGVNWFDSSLSLNDVLLCNVLLFKLILMLCKWCMSLKD